MTDWAHDTLVQVLTDRLSDLDALLALSMGVTPPTPIAWSVQDSVLRPSPSVEVRPDLVCVASDGDWKVLEVQRAIDPEKSRRWPLAAALMLDAQRRMGDVVVLTASPHVARWARTVASHTGSRGTRLSVVPTVVLLHGPWVESLLDPARPELGFYAAWAMHERHGPRAQRVVTRALAQADTLPPELKAAHLARQRAKHGAVEGVREQRRHGVRNFGDGLPRATERRGRRRSDRRAEGVVVRLHVARLPELHGSVPSERCREAHKPPELHRTHGTT